MEAADGQGSQQFVFFWRDELGIQSFRDLESQPVIEFCVVVGML